MSNLFLHYTFDLWMQRQYPEKLWCRYADDGLVHCDTEEQAQELLVALRRRFTECELELHPDKTRIIYCRDKRRKGKYQNTSFDFLGYTFRGRSTKSKWSNEIYQSFNPAVSRSSLNAMRAKTKRLNWRNRTDLSLEEIADEYNPVLQGWLNYYGAHTRSGLYPVWRHFNKTLVAWAKKKYKQKVGKIMDASRFMQGIAKRTPDLFVHWRLGIVGNLA